LPHPRLVLIVDDDCAVRDSLRALLESFDYSVLAAANAGEAMRQVGARRPDVILTDIYMPDGDGFELINAMRSVEPPVPIIAMSAEAEHIGSPNQLGIAQRLGAYAAIAKPFQASLLMQTLDNAMSSGAAAG
jgi:CheY-like chemotaxis protein